ncbi:MAG TPA: biotin--[acetyl-CoA-carboxylase] ligase [Actinomycetota bacterium]|jgi:BirA family biotin operon repressor/biotin-[acetyl-CoA-carboxylase] ligase
MLTEQVVSEAVRAAHLDAPVHFLEVTDSTNSDLLRLADEGAPEWTVVVANQQEAGRGRLGRAWVSTPGSSLLVSVLLRPKLAAVDAPLITLAAGAAMALACREACDVPATCKWPNDLMVEARKLGGVLVEAKVQEARLHHAVIGSGVNLTQAPDDFPVEFREAATSVSMEEGRPEPAALLTAYLTHLKPLCETSDPGIRTQILDTYVDVCDTIGRFVRAMTTSRVTITGRAAAIGYFGELIVQTAKGQEPVRFGEIAHLD